MYAELSFGKLLQKQDNHIELPAAVVGGEGKEKLFLHELEVSTSLALVQGTGSDIHVYYCICVTLWNKGWVFHINLQANDIFMWKIEKLKTSSKGKNRFLRATPKQVERLMWTLYKNTTHAPILFMYFASFINYWFELCNHLLQTLLLFFSNLFPTKLFSLFWCCFQLISNEILNKIQIHFID